MEDAARVDVREPIEDLKPSNILLGADGRAKIADFGVSRSASVRSTVLTAPESTPPGTPLFMAPEQVRGVPGDARSDLYALAVTAYQTLTGRFYLGPEPRDDFELRRAVLEQAPALPAPEIPGPLEEWLAVGLAKDPDARFADATTMRAALSAALADVERSWRASAGP